jgi:ATP-binding cassette subfamily B protein
MQQAQASAERIISLIETPIDIYDTEEVKSIYGTILSPKRENWEDLEGYVEFNHVTFSYTQKEVVLKDFNLKVNKGEVVALVGTTGAGKSTIVNLLCRFYEPTSGEILIDGKNYKERSINWLHEKLGYVLQTPHLFNGSIKENIAYGKMDASMDEIIEAAKKAQAHEFIMKLKDGYDTSVGEGGAKLSLGERQLISFARAIIKDPKILILDEATSSIDTETEVLIQDVMNNFMKGRTTFIVAHRLSTIINADKILVISNGEIKESGTHKELLKQEGIYYNLYKNQFINEQMDKSIK